MNDTPPKTKVSLEDLLRLKRAEQPPAEFWVQFERGLRTKQLAAIVEPRPWWAPFIRVGARISRYQLPVGATAILAVTLLTLREYHPSGPVQPFETASAELASLPTPTPADSNATAVSTETIPVATGNLVATPVNEMSPSVTGTETRADDIAPAVTPAVGIVSHVGRIDSELSSARYMAEKLAGAQIADSNTDQMLGHSLRTADSLAAPREPLAQISVQRSSPLYHWQGAAAQSASLSTGDSALRLNEQAARRLTERRLSESDVISRLNVGGNRVTVKF